MTQIKFIIIISTFITVSAGVRYVRQPGANHAPRASVTQVNLSVQILSTFLRIRADPNMQIFWISVTLALLDTFSMFSIIPFFTNIIIILLLLLLLLLLLPSSSLLLHTLYNIA